MTMTQKNEGIGLGIRQTIGFAGPAVDVAQPEVARIRGRVCAVEGMQGRHPVHIEPELSIGEALEQAVIGTRVANSGLRNTSIAGITE